MSEGRVVSMFGGPTGERQVSDDVIRVLEDLLERAHSGEVIGFSGAVLVHDGCANFYACGMVGGYSMIGALEMAKSEVLDVLRGEC